MHLLVEQLRITDHLCGKKHLEHPFTNIKIMAYVSNYTHCFIRNAITRMDG